MERNSKDFFDAPPAMSEEELQQYLIDEDLVSSDEKTKSNWRAKSLEHALKAFFFLSLGLGHLFSGTGTALFFLVGAFFLTLGLWDGWHAFLVDQNVYDDDPQGLREPHPDHPRDPIPSASGPALARLRHSYSQGPPTMTEEEAHRIEAEVEKDRRKTTRNLPNQFEIGESAIFGTYTLILGIYVLINSGLYWLMLGLGLGAIALGGSMVYRAYRDFQRAKKSRNGSVSR